MKDSMLFSIQLAVHVNLSIQFGLKGQLRDKLAVCKAPQQYLELNSIKLWEYTPDVNNYHHKCLRDEVKTDLQGNTDCGHKCRPDTSIKGGNQEPEDPHSLCCRKLLQQTQSLLTRMVVPKQN